MKKWLALFLAVAMMATVLVGCNNSAGNASGGEDNSWTEVEKSGKLILGMDTAFPPMGYRDEQSGELVGFDLDVATEVCARLGLELVKQPINWKNQVNEINNDNVDCLWNGMSKTEGRYQNMADVAGKNLGVQAGSSAEEALNASTEFKNSLGDIINLDDYSKAIMEMKNGTIDAIAIDEVVARYYLTKEPNTYRILTKEDGSVESLAVEDYVIGFKIGDDALKTKIEDTLKDMAKDGKLAEISTKWFGEDVTTIVEE